MPIATYCIRASGSLHRVPFLTILELKQHCPGAQTWNTSYLTESFVLQMQQDKCWEATSEQRVQNYIMNECVE